MKFIVNELPYYEDFCPLYPICWDNANDHKYPRYWSKDKVCSDDNPHECLLFIENDKSISTNDHGCQDCKHFGDLDMKSSCAICFGYSKWEAKDE